MNDSLLERRISVASGKRKAELVLRGAQVVNVFTAQLERADVAIQDGYIAGIGEYDGEEVKDLSGMILCPGLIDGHIHLESSMVTPREFERAVLPHGTTAVITDPHEIANVAGIDGIRYMMDSASRLDLDVFFMLPSCVPSTALDESGAVLAAADLESLYSWEKVLGLAEMMDFYGVAKGQREIVRKLEGAMRRGKLVDGHAPGLSKKGLNAYIAAGVTTDHECSGEAEALEKLRLGQWIMIREGTAAKNLEALFGLFREPYFRRCMLVTDDRHPGDLIRLGHIDAIIKKAVRLGADPLSAIIMGSYNAALAFGLPWRGAVAPGYIADLAAVSDLENFQVEQVYKGGRLAAEKGRLTVGCAEEKPAPTPRPVRVFRSFHLKKAAPEDFHFPGEGVHGAGDPVRVISLTPHQLVTGERIVPWTVRPGFAPGVDVENDIVKLAVLERHRGTGHMGLGFLSGYGLREGAVASSVAHDSHNLIVVGVNDGDMALAANTVRENGGGLAVVSNGRVLGDLPLPIAGLMSEEGIKDVDEKLEALKRLAAMLGVSEEIDPFMTLAFASLPVIPKLRLNTMGLIDVQSQSVTGVWTEHVPGKEQKEGRK